MPIAVKTWRDAFKFELHEAGAPIAPVYQLGNGRWAQCPLCGCIHDVTSYQGQDYQPVCVTVPRLYANRRTEWLKVKKHQPAAEHRRVWLVAMDMPTANSVQSIPAAKAFKFEPASASEAA